MIKPKLLFLKFALLFGPIGAFFAADALVLPINTFTFREWEALTINAGHSHPQYAFYPNQTLHQREYGDTFRYDAYITPRTTTWVTDAMGYRNRASYDIRSQYCFATIGDSNTIGSFLDQHETLAEVLENKSGCKSYNAGSLEITSRFFNRKEFRASPPRYLIFQTVAGYFYDDGFAARFAMSGQFAGVEPAPAWYHRVLAKAIALFAPGSPRATPWMLKDLIDRSAAFNFVQARLGLVGPRTGGALPLHRSGQSLASINPPSDYGEALYKGPSVETYMQTCPAAVLDVAAEASRRASCRFVNTVQAMSEALAQRGTELVVFLQPSGDTELTAGIAYLEGKGVKIVYFPVTANEPFGIDMDWYWAQDDVHWNPRAVQLAADMILARINGRSPLALLADRKPQIEAETLAAINR
jgi:hypothetical protein